MKSRITFHKTEHCKVQVQPETLMYILPGQRMNSGPPKNLGVALEQVNLDSSFTDICVRNFKFVSGANASFGF
jgi:hypothetical protein